VKIQLKFDAFTAEYEFFADLVKARPDACLRHHYPHLHRKCLMITIRLSSNEYATLVEQAPILIWRADLTMGCDFFNDRWLAFTGRTMEQESGNGWAEGVHPDDLPRCLKIYTESFARREVFEMEYRLRRVDGVFRWLFDRGVPFNGPTGQFSGYIGSCIDVTERIDAQTQLKAVQELEVKLLQELLPVCSWCNKIREDSGYWRQLESYVSQHSALRFTHGICPDCKGKHFPNTLDSV
jgi:PAS domain S-box-containing protein